MILSKSIEVFCDVFSCACSQAVEVLVARLRSEINARYGSDTNTSFSLGVVAPRAPGLVLAIVGVVEPKLCVIGLLNEMSGVGF